MHSLTGGSCSSLRCQPTVWTSPVCPLCRWATHVLEKQWTPLYSANSQIWGCLSCPTGSRAAMSLTAVLLQRRCGQDLGEGEPQLFVLVVSWLICRDWRSGWNTDEGNLAASWSTLPFICPPVWVGAAVPQDRAMLNHQHLRACCSVCLWATASLKCTSYLSNGSHQNKLLKARHRSMLPGFSVRGENRSLWDLSCSSGNQYQSSIGFNERRIQPGGCDI